MLDLVGIDLEQAAELARVRGEDGGRSPLGEVLERAGERV